MEDNAAPKQKQRIDEMEAFLREHAAKGTPWEQVLDGIKSNFSPPDVACLIDRINPTALNLRIIYQGIRDKRF